MCGPPTGTALPQSLLKGPARSREPPPPTVVECEHLGHLGRRSPRHSKPFAKPRCPDPRRTLPPFSVLAQSPEFMWLPDPFVPVVVAPPENVLEGGPGLGRLRRSRSAGGPG